MSRTEILTQIKAVEKAAKEMVEAARVKSKEDISKARRDAVKRIQDEEEKKRYSVAGVITAKNEELEVERGKILKDGLTEAEKIEKSSLDNKKEVRDFLYKEFKRPIDVIS
ncbi:MAG TPA: hypothetical protein VJX93_00370 [Candidatus Methanomethylophilaceae archaeon]|nr:hypothetical protein [Candidatus Methanomethylophilaceae archaeon]